MTGLDLAHALALSLAKRELDDPLDSRGWNDLLTARFVRGVAQGCRHVPLEVGQLEPHVPQRGTRQPLLFFHQA